MFDKTITLFNRYRGTLGDTWYATVVTGCQLVIDKASLVSKYGENSSDRISLHIPYTFEDGKRVIAGKEFLPPKEWAKQTNDKLADTVTFQDGQAFDFFIIGEYADTETPINDEDYKKGFYDFLNKNNDYVYAITSIGIYDAIPHFELLGK